VTLLVGPRVLPEFRAPEPGRLDLAGALMSIGSVLLLVSALKRGVGGGPSTMVVAAAGAGLALGWLFARRQCVSSAPVVDVSLFGQPVWCGSCWPCC
jgi:DHA2 family multidrug resistance protein-like MFS transporter